MTITGNDERDRMIYQAMKTAANRDEILSLDNVKSHLPSDFDLLPRELVACRHAAKLDSLAPLNEIAAARAPLVAKTPDGRALVAATTEPQGSVPTGTDLQGSVSTDTDLEPEARLTQAQARRAVESAAKRLDLARLNVRMTRSALDAQRGKLAVAIEAWQNGGPKWTPEMERKAMLATYAANKGNGPRMNTRKHPAQAVIAGRGVVTGYKGSHRNGLPSEMQHRNIAQAAMFHGGIAKKI